MTREDLGEHLGHRPDPEVIVAVADREAALMQRHPIAAAMVLQRGHEHLPVAWRLCLEWHVHEEQLVVGEVRGVVKRAAGDKSEPEQNDRQGPTRGDSGGVRHGSHAIGRIGVLAQAMTAFACDRPKG